MTKIRLDVALALVIVTLWLLPSDRASAHHVLGRPSYSLNEDSNTPPSVQAEIQIGDYLVTYLVYPAFPRPGTPGRINLYATRIDDGTPFEGNVTFKVRGDSWFSWLGLGGDEVSLGVQPPDDSVFRQGYEFHEAGDYIITAEFQAGGEPYVIVFPLRVGEASMVGPIGIIVGVVLVVLATISLVQRRRSMTGKIRGARTRKSGG